MKSRPGIFALSALTVAAALTVALPATPAFATDEVGCDTGDPVKMTYLQDGVEHTRCWDGPGPVSPNQDGVTSLYTGANEVLVVWTEWQRLHYDLVAPHSWVPFTGADGYRVFGFQVR